MRITIERMTGKEFSKLVDYINSPENIADFRGSKYLKVVMTCIGLCESPQNVKPPVQDYGNIELQVRTGMNPEELSGLMRMIYRSEEGEQSQ